ncbi:MULTISPECIES: hypothetical protein [unclassified Streptomyces]|uniref:hypothetical protein n=1 Tax=unclassified Streptomyces TaxID=2593676 RepID=UPI003700BFDB
MYIVFFGWTAADSNAAPWQRVVTAVLLMASVILLVKQLLERAGSRAASRHPNDRHPEGEDADRDRDRTTERPATARPVVVPKSRAPAVVHLPSAPEWKRSGASH